MSNFKNDNENTFYHIEDPKTLEVLGSRSFARITLENGTLTLDKSALSSVKSGDFIVKSNAGLRSQEPCKIIAANMTIDCAKGSHLDFVNVRFEAPSIKISSVSKIEYGMVLVGSDKVDMSESNSKVGKFLAIKSSELDLNHAKLEVPYLVVKSDKVNLSDCHSKCTNIIIDAQDIDLTNACLEVSRVYFREGTNLINRNPEDNNIFEIKSRLADKIIDPMIDIIVSITGEDSGF